MDSKEAARVLRAMRDASMAHLIDVHQPNVQALDIAISALERDANDGHDEACGEHQSACAKCLAMEEADRYVPVPRAELERLIAHASCSQSQPGHYRISVPEYLWNEVIGKALEAKERGDGSTCWRCKTPGCVCP